MILRRRGAKAAIVCALLVVTAGGRPAWACSCGAPRSVAEAFVFSDVIFSGTVTEVRRNWWGYHLPAAWFSLARRLGLEVERPTGYALRVAFEIDEAFKGIERDKVWVASDRDASACGIPWEVGWEVIVYALHDSRSDPPIVTNSCTRNGFVNLEEVAALRAVAGTLSRQPLELKPVRP